MISININAVALGPVLLVLGLSLVIGIAVALLEGFAGIFVGFAKGIAGIRSDNRTNKGHVFFRAMIYVAACVGAIYLCVHGYQLFAYCCAILGGVALPIAIGKLRG